MPAKPPPPWQPAPETRYSRLAWAERERVLTRRLHAASTRRWVLRMFIGISRLSDGWLWLGFAFVLPWLDHHRGTDCVVRMVAVGTLNLLLYVIIKRYVARPRPYRSCDGVQACIRSLDEYSFPSGHTLHSVACGIVICVYYPPLAWVLAPFALLVAMSRVVLGLHYPSDVLIGALMGAVTAGISFNLL